MKIEGLRIVAVAPFSYYLAGATAAGEIDEGLGLQVLGEAPDQRVG